MYNLATQITALSANLDQAKKERLHDIKAVARKVLSLSSTNHPMKTFGSITGIGSVTEGHERHHGPQDEGDLGVFEAEDIQKVLH